MKTNSILIQPETTMPLSLHAEKTQDGATLEHTARRTSSITLNHVRGPSATVEIQEMKERRGVLLTEVQRLTKDIADAELLQMLSA